ncbi:AraC family transcriptional regulator [Janthinobacterium agaricidamnosum]|uniref:Bacterial regulatory helix-turn-helix s, AraC family protein n=1 Tax=Janthinobacterium agaricidamnosum NBRC 102515 = DSM 9628 TaxID=1349767 RepID=W0V5G6_9BURK|nr:AraC family transcriptional regulator [Janthinobacterium agaricidamnosum]CDG82593.1 bacterial regulatory helix-turn-helix s, AraC family protein [Janthinobacterium agaricidamnosum NBRC 102515 = DSM 9628]
MIADPFSDILKLVSAETVVSGGFCAGGSWALRFPPPDKIKFCVIVKGSCWAWLDGEIPLRAETGDVLLIAARRAFTLAGDLDAVPMDVMRLASCIVNNTAQIGDGADFSQMGGHVQLDPVNGALLADVLPPWIHVRAAAPQASALQWILGQLVRESSGELPGAGLASSQLAQLMLIQVLRAHLATSGPLTAGWLRAVSDKRLAPALRLLHGDPGRAWQLEELAKASAMSRTTFALHFKTVAGLAPLTYLTEWRMRLAERALREENMPVAVLARSLGYTSESAFSNAFKRITGNAPKRYRIAAREAGL